MSFALLRQALQSAGSMGNGGGSATEPAELQNNVPVTNLAAQADGDKLYFFINVPAGFSRLTVTQSGGTGDSDLHVRYGAVPDDNNYDCRPFESGNNEVCYFGSGSPVPANGSFSADVTPGAYYIMLDAYVAFSRVSLTAQYFNP